MERFAAKCNVELKLGCVYIVDSICRACKKEKDEKFASFVARFESRLLGIFEALAQQRIPSKDKVRAADYLEYYLICLGEDKACCFTLGKVWDFYFDWVGCRSGEIS